MTRIITITSGTAQAGKTQLALNLALELVRRGHQTGVFQDIQAARMLDEQLDLHHHVIPQRRVTDQPAGDVLRSGYQGVDFLSCRLPLTAWAAADAERLKSCIHDMDTHDGYDDLLVDTSAMAPATVLACCLAAGVVVVMVTPDLQSQAEAFALIRILRLNGFDGELRLVVNQVRDEQQAAEVRERLNTQVRHHLGVEIPLLSSLAADRYVAMALRSRQAVSSVYPDSALALAVVGIADALGTLGNRTRSTRQTVTRFWKTFLDKIRVPVQLPGHLTLTDLPEPGPGASATRAMVPVETGLVQFDGSLALLCDTLVSLPRTLGVLAQDMQELVAALAGTQTLRVVPDRAACSERECLQLAAAILNGVCASATQREQVHLQVTECHQEADTPNWLHNGDYMRFSFLIGTQGNLLDRLQTVFSRLRLPPLPGQVEENGVLWERINPTRNVSLGISVTLPDELRMVLWVPAHRVAAAAADVPAAAAAKR
ncbi:MAG: hypothetical protein R3F42_07695 [Pseudomonadota bacterium]